MDEIKFLNEGYEITANIEKRGLATDSIAVEIFNASQIDEFIYIKLITTNGNSSDITLLSRTIQAFCDQIDEHYIMFYAKYLKKVNDAGLRKARRSIEALTMLLEMNHFVSVSDYVCLDDGELFVYDKDVARGTSNRLGAAVIALTNQFLAYQKFSWLVDMSYHKDECYAVLKQFKDHDCLIGLQKLINDYVMEYLLNNAESSGSGATPLHAF